MTPAEIIASAQCFMIEGCLICGSIEGCQLATSNGYRDDAVKIIAALAAAGLKIVSKYPTVEMVNIAVEHLAPACDEDIRGAWAAMIDAVPPLPLDAGSGMTLRNARTRARERAKG